MLSVLHPTLMIYLQELSFNYNCLLSVHPYLSDRRKEHYKQSLTFGDSEYMKLLDSAGELFLTQNR